MKRFPLSLALSILFFVALAAGMYVYTTAMMDSMFNFRSPLKDQPPAPGAALGESATRRVVYVLIDGLRADTATNAQVMPTLARLRQGGASALMHSQPPSFSQTGYSMIFTGAWPSLSDGPALNVAYEKIPAWTQDTLFSALQRSGKRSAISGYYWFEKLVPAGSVSRSFYTPGEDAKADVDVVQAALPWLKTPDTEFVLIHLDQVDYAGHHEGGALDPRWNEAATRCDTLLAEIVAQLDLKQDTVLVTSDHGHIDRGGHGGHDATTLLEPFVLAGAGIQPGAYGDVQMVDIAPTLAALLGTNLPASSQGQVRADMLTLPASVGKKLPDAVKAQQSLLLQRYAASIGENLAVPAPLSAAVSDYQALIEQVQKQRLNRERWIPALVVALVTLLPLAWAWRKRSKALLSNVGGAVLVLALFNLRYLLLDGRAYSLSSLDGVTAVVVYFLLTVTIALGLVGTGLGLAQGWFREGPARAAQAMLNLTGVTAYLSMLPMALNIALNGPLTTWILNDLALITLAFYYQVFTLTACIGGLLLAGIFAAASFAAASFAATAALQNRQLGAPKATGH